jgi:flagellar biogenesis protein FliO
MRLPKVFSTSLRASALLIFILACATPTTRLAADESTSPAQNLDTAAKQPDAVSSWLRANSTANDHEERVLRRHNNKSAVQHAALTDAKPGSPSLFWVLPLMAVLAVIFIATMVARRWLPGVRQMTGGGVIHILTRRYLSSKQSLCLVRLGPRVVLLGVTPEHITALADIDDSQEVSRMVAAVESSRPGSFTRTMSALAPNEQEAAEPGPREAWSVSSTRLSDAADGIRGILAKVREASKAGASPST